MKQPRHIRLISATLVIASLLIAVIALSASAELSAGQAAVSRSPRPHPTSQLSGGVKPIVVNGIARIPRPHPKSHIEMLINRP